MAEAVIKVDAQISKVSRALAVHLGAAYAGANWTSAPPVIRHGISGDADVADAAGSLHVVLLHIGPDSTARQAATPSREDGARTPTPLSCELHYLIAAQADDVLLAEDLLGQAACRLHQRSWISVSDGTGDPMHLQISPMVLSLADVGAIWQGLRRPMRPSLVYRTLWAPAVDRTAAPKDVVVGVLGMGIGRFERPS